MALMLFVMLIARRSWNFLAWLPPRNACGSRRGRRRIDRVDLSPAEDVHWPPEEDKIRLAQAEPKNNFPKISHIPVEIK